VEWKALRGFPSRGRTLNVLPGSAAANWRSRAFAPREKITRLKSVALFLIFAAVLLTWSYLQIPESMNFDRFAFCDHGANLTLQYLVSNGYRPTVNFGYNYGLLPLLAGHLWFTLVGQTASGYLWAMIACNILAAWGIATIIAEFKVGFVGIVLIMFTLGYAVQPSYPNLAQALEAVLLIFALTRQARGASAGALAFSSAAIFAKPAMGYLYSLLLVLLIASRLWRQRAGVRVWIEMFAPAALVCVVLAALLSTAYGIRPLVNTIFPFEGAANYRAAHFGFFREAGREFWATAGVPWWVHLFDVSGFWMVSTLILVCIAAADWLRLCQAYEPSVEGRRKTEVILTCAILNVLFIFFFFGNRGSWIYYSFLIVIGTTLAVDSTRFRRILGLLVCAVAVCSWTDLLIAIRYRATTTQPSALTKGLWATPEERSEWSSVLALAARNTTRILDLKGDAELMFPLFGRPVTLYLDPGLIRSDEIRQTISQLDDARLIVVPINMPNCSGIPQTPEIASVMKSFDPLWKGKFFEIFERRPLVKPNISAQPHDVNS